MVKSARSVLWICTLGAAAQASWAVGFGRLPTTATLGQPLQLSVPLRLEPNEELAPECLSAQVSYADNLQQPGTTTLKLQPAAPGALERTLILSTTTRVDEPIVSIEISVGCASKVSRRFTLLADPPLFNPPTPAVAAAPVPPSDAASVPASSGREEGQAPVAAAPAASASPSAPAPAQRPAVKRRAPPPTNVATAPRPPRPAARAPATDSARLRLAPLEAGARVGAAPAPAAPAPAASAAAPVASAPAAAAVVEAAAASVAAAEQAASAATVAAASAQARVDELEATMKKLRAQDATTQQTIASLQARLQRAESEQLGSPLMYALAALAALLLGAVIWLWRQRSADREAQGWLVQAAAASGDAAAQDQSPATSAETAAFAPVPTLKAWVSKPNEEGFDDTLALTRAGTMSTMPAALNSGQTPLDSLKPLVPEAQKREVSVEELIDLEQQAEFFIVLGQDEAAIDLLMTHLRSTAGTSPLPYLKLLEIYKRRGERADYEKLRERFNSRFNAYAPSWETDLQGGRTLDEYPSVMGRLESLWVTPPRAREVLQATLVRAEDSGPDPVGDDSFDLPAYRELMLLYSIARDVSDEQADEPPVDVMLPIGDDSAPSAAVFERLLATSSMPAQPGVHKPLEVDFTLDDPPKRPDDPKL